MKLPNGVNWPSPPVDIKLIDEQVEAAAKACYEAQSSERSWKLLKHAYKHHYRAGVRAAAPFLQMLWELPSYGEIQKAAIQGECQFNTPDYTYAFGIPSALAWFVFQRNTALLPKPVDPRREKIRAAINDLRSGPDATKTSEMVDRIIAALDAKE